ncbi:MAG TPA: hypothetical protein VGB00_07330, partial [Pyrinomonadaceae bacterium]
LRASTNLYTVFFHPTRLALRKKEKPPEETGDGQPENWWKRIKKIWEEGVGILPAAETFLFTLALYDIAGEDYERRVELVQDLENKVDKIALVIDATDLIPGKSDGEDNLADCDGYLNLLKDQNKPFCVVLTKTDEFFKRAVKKEPKVAEVLTQMRNEFFLGNQSEIKSFLKKWRQASMFFKTSPHPHNLDKVLKILSEAEFPIFLIETVNLPSQNDESIDVSPPKKLVTEQPVTFGLDTVVCWCLEVEVGEIIENP